VADTVEIQNVGGLRGVASEATLLELLDAIVAQNRGGSSGSRLSSRLQDAYNRSLTETNREQGRLAKAFNYITNNAAGRFAKELAFGGNRVSNFSDAIFGAGSSISILTGYLDDNIDTWRELSSVGASFNNSIFDMMGSAANSGMELDDFSKLIIKNSEQMAKFGGTVTNGAKFFGDFSKTFRRDLGSRFFEMGFTIGDINESLVDFMSLESRRSANGLRNDKKTQESAANYTLQLDKLAKLTGEERKQLADRIAQQQTDAGIAARINSLQGAQQENLQSAIAFFDSQLPGMSDGFKDLMDGVAQTDLGKALESAIPGIGQYMQQVFTGEEDVGEVLAALKNKFGPALANFTSGFGKAQIDQMRTQGGVVGALAELMDSLYQMNQVSQLSAEEAAEEQERRNAVTSTLGKFEQAVVDLRKMFVDFFYDFAMEEGGLFDALSGLGDVVKDLISPGPNGLGGLGTSFMTSVKNNIFGLFGKDGSITKWITVSTAWLKSDDFKVFVEDLEESIASVTTWFSELGDDISNKGFWNTFKERIFDLGNWIKELFLGSTVTEMTQDGPQEVRTEGLLEKIQEYIFGDELTRPGDSLYDRFIDWVGLDSRSDESLLSQVYDRFIDWVGLDSRSDESLLSQVYNKVLDAFLGKEVMVGREDDRKLERQGGLFEKLQEYIFGDELTRPGDSLYDRFIDWVGLDSRSDESLLSQVYDRFIDWVGLDSRSDESLLSQVYNKVLDAFLGKEVMVGREDDRKLERQGGLFESFATGFSNLFNNTEIITSMTSAFQKLFDTVINGFVNFWESDSAKGIKDIVVNMFNEIYIRVLEVLDQIPFVDMSEQLRSMSYSSQDRLSSGGKISAKEAENIREQLANDIASMEDSMAGLNWFLNSQEEIDQKTQSIEFLKQRQTEIDAMLAALGQAEVNSNAQGTSGFQDFGKKSYATLHGIEAVVPRNTAAGDVLQSFYDFQNKKVADVTSTPMTSPMASDNQSSLIKKIEELNTTMMRVAELLQSSVGLQAKTVKGVKGLGSDFYRGIGR
jgi:hypothetical protein